jgi:hypothetical protein
MRKMTMSLTKSKRTFEDAKASSLPLALAVKQKATRKSPTATAMLPEPREPQPASLADAIIAKRKAPTTEPGEFAVAEDPAEDTYDLLDDTKEPLEELEAAQSLVDRIRARMKARRGY